MLIQRFSCLVGAAVVLVAACGGSSKDGSGGSSGQGGTGGSAGSVANGGSGDGEAATGGSAMSGGTGGSADFSSSSGKGGSGDKGGSGGAAGKGGAGGKGGSSGTGGTPAGGTGGDAAGEAGMAAPGVPIDEAPTTVAVDLCDKIYECCSADELMNIQGIGTSKGQCQLAVAIVITLQVNAVKPAIAAGRVAYDGSALSRCLDDYGSRSCDMLRGIEAFECEGLIVPKQAVGEACGVDSECIDGYCDGSSNANNPVGKCVPTRENGADCTGNVECQSGFCDTEGKCAAPESSALCGG